MLVEIIMQSGSTIGSIVGASHNIPYALAGFVGINICNCIRREKVLPQGHMIDEEEVSTCEIYLAHHRLFMTVTTKDDIEVFC